MDVSLTVPSLRFNTADGTKRIIIPSSTGNDAAFSRMILRFYVVDWTVLRLYTYESGGIYPQHYWKIQMMQRQWLTRYTVHPEPGYQKRKIMYCPWKSDKSIIICIRISWTLIMRKLCWIYYRSGTLNSNTVNSKFHLIRTRCEYLATILSWLIRTWLIWSSTYSKGI